MLENIRGLFFDLDDTLINFGGVTRETWNLTCEKLVKEYPTLVIEPKILADKINEVNELYWSEENRPKGNVNFRKAREEIIMSAFTSLGIGNNKLALDFLLDNYSIYKEEAIYLLPSVHETLSEFKKMGKKLVLITNGDGKRQREKLHRFDLEKYFDLILIEGEQGFGKPDARSYQKALDVCGVEASEACMVGDNYLWEVEAPIKLGLKGVWINFLNQKIPEERTVEPDLIIQNISELLSW